MDPSERVALGATPLRVTRLGLGTVPIGGQFGPVTVTEAHAVIRRSYELGIRMFDTAPQYGLGLAERRIGEVLPELPRADIVLATKVGRLIRPVSFVSKVGHVLRQAPSRRRNGIKLVGSKAWRVVRRATFGNSSDIRLGTPFDRGNRALGEVFDFSYDGVMRSFEESLRRLGTDHVDILHIHDPDDHYAEALSGAYKALDKLRGEGAIGAIGAGMRQSAMLSRFAREADFDCFLLAGRYTLLDQTALTDLLPLCVEKRIGVVLGGVYNSGILVDPRPGALFDYEAATGHWVKRAQRLKAVCDRHSVPLMAAAIQFPLAHPAVATVLTGVASTAELETNVRMFRTQIPPALWQELRAEGLLAEEAPVPTVSSVVG